MVRCAIVRFRDMEKAESFISLTETPEKLDCKKSNGEVFVHPEKGCTKTDRELRKFLKSHNRYKWDIRYLENIK